MRTQQLSSAGPNPLQYMGLCTKSDGKAYLCEIEGNQWRWYPDYTLSVPWPVYLRTVQAGTVQTLSSGTSEYDYVAMNGYQNFSVWVALAASYAGR